MYSYIRNYVIFIRTKDLCQFKGNWLNIVLVFCFHFGSDSKWLLVIMKRLQAFWWTKTEMGSRGYYHLRIRLFCDDVIINWHKPLLKWLCQNHIEVLSRILLMVCNFRRCLKLNDTYTQKMSTTVSRCNQLLFKMLQLQNCHLEWTYAHNSQSL